ncbi:MAG TPA: SDR family oxidoreductase [Candidatus Omnitrophota bacterium]|nr:SDR family oxidoreductase [Candidatus Omnitrophota bacterium]HPD85358.1 SDR family oxidoreductase [Candidatus Omnitrophota bacterium]HRZ04141.1 SDR family oxidoreductase [Candidatus Omnitrophota bacterium]
MPAAALVTGGSKRIGKEIALALASMGYAIALHYNQSKEDAKKTATQIKAKGRSCEIFQCDLSNENETRLLVTNVKKRFSNLNLLINSASIFESSKLASPNTIHSLSRHFAVNFKAPYILSCEFYRLCKKGSIINLLDANITKNKTGYPEYLLSKKALADFTRVAAVEFAPYIRVNAIAPGLILPPEGKTNAYLNRLAKNIPLKTRGSTAQITSTVKFLAENQYLTGQIIFVDGGAHLLNAEKA